MFLETFKEFLYLKYKETIARVPWLWVSIICVEVVAFVAINISMYSSLSSRVDDGAPCVILANVLAMFSGSVFSVAFGLRSVPRLLAGYIAAVDLWLGVVLCNIPFMDPGMTAPSILIGMVLMAIGAVVVSIFLCLASALLKWVWSNWSLAKRRVTARRSGETIPTF